MESVERTPEPGRAAKGWAAIKRPLDGLLSFFYPECCQVCHAARATPDEGFVCGDCRGNVRWVVPPCCGRCGLPFPGDLTTPFECANCRDVELHFRFARSAVVADGMVMEIIHRYKYSGELWFEPFLAELLVNQARTSLRRADWDFIVPVPLHGAREREREFNQSARLASLLARALGIPLNARALRRVQPTRTQALLSREERAGNVRGAFAARAGAVRRGARAVVFDDVLTTGATTSECARVLRDAGAADVCVWTLGRATFNDA